MKPVFALAALLTLGCATTEQESPSLPQGCDASRLSDLTGRPASEALGAEALRRSGARTVRWIRPGDVVTMDFRSDRLNIHLDGQGQAVRFDCG